MADKLRTQQQLEQLQNRFIGVGHADTTKHEWISNIHRDTYTSYIGHPALLEQFAVALNESQNTVKTRFIDNMIQPCGPPKEIDLDQ
ncbi:splicing factor 3B subunit 5/RDS3 complex subunit 10 [Lipomyces oligophaga]|uniref:splicing factor 3B subunit 5/RDS3 complex subunit 10 n=1 Tax=Lipomyces oligophaga TaxID=45792 RepID=UPI0034CFB78C